MSRTDDQSQTQIRQARRSGMTRRGLFAMAGGGLAAVGWMASIPGVARADPGAAAVNPELLGTPLISPNIKDAAAFGTWPDGRPVAYAVSNGVPMAFSALDLRTGELLASHAIVDSGSSYDLSVAPDAQVYISDFTAGHLYRYKPDGDSVTDLGAAVSGEFVMNRTTIVDSPRGYLVYGGTYPNGHLFCFDPMTSKFTDLGVVADGETYLRSLAFGGGRLYVGTGTHARLFSVDPDTLARQEIALPAPHAGQEIFVYDLAYCRGILFVYVSPSLSWLMYDVRTGTWLDDVANNPQSGISPPIGRSVFFADGDTGDLHSYDLVTHKVVPTGFADGTLDSNTTRAVGVARLGGPDFPGQSVVGIGLNGGLWHWNPITDKIRRVATQPLGSAAEIHTMGCGPDGNIYLGGFWTSGLLVRYDVDDAELEQLSGPNQIEGIASWQGKLYLGCYQNPASVMAFDPADPWVFGSNPSTVLSFADTGQERPYALAPAGDRLAIGTIAVKGEYDGALTFLDPATGQVELHVGIVSNQGVCALASVGNLLVGGTSIVPSGVPAIAASAELFIWDISAGQKIWEGSPVSAPDIAELVFDADGLLWALTSTGIVFAFDTSSREVLRSVKVIPDTGTQTSQWGQDTMFFSGDGKLYGSSVGRVFSLDPTSMTAEVLDSGSFAAQDDQHRIYYAKTAQLYRMEPLS